MPAGNTHIIILSPRITDLRLSPFYYLLCGVGLTFHPVSLTSCLKSMHSDAQDRVSKLLLYIVPLVFVLSITLGKEARGDCLFITGACNISLFLSSHFFLLAHFVRSTKLTAGFLSSICFPYIHFASLTWKKPCLFCPFGRKLITLLDRFLLILQLPIPPLRALWTHLCL